MTRDYNKTVGSLIDKQKTAFIASVDEEGFPIVKAMNAPRKREGIKTFYFSTNTFSKAVAAFRENPKASIYFYDRHFFRSVLLKGTMNVLEDKKSKELIWENGDTAYYYKGVEDPDYCVLKFTAGSGRMYQKLASEDFLIE
ncbi:pyridoxamine 5'-phosphate oxidase family protein [Lachnospiraceae bacterium ZAX-1]